MKYHIHPSQPHLHFIDIDYTIENVTGDTLEIQLPAWRPGRYELGNFAKNVQKWQATDAKGNPLAFQKVTKDRWVVQTSNTSTVKVAYNYYANELNAGSTLYDEQQLYMNPVNCMLYTIGREEEPIEITFDLPEDYEIATGLTQVEQHRFQASGFQQLADCPLIASNSLQHHTFEVNQVLFHLWFQGEVKPDWDRLTTDFIGYTKAQFAAFGSFPVSEYHYLFQIVPYRHYHGVEHQNSTVISLGPSYDIMGRRYDDLLGVSSHELYHTWNIKNIRPAEMLPYDFSKENYSELGYVAEGVTTYYGDLMLYRGGVFNQVQYHKELDNQIQRHMDNFGRYNLSVAESSFDTWLDGYVQGIPDRKVSIYTEGCLLALIADIQIMQATDNDASLNDVMRLLYQRFGQTNQGYTAADYQATLEEVSGVSFADFFEKYVRGTQPIYPLLEDALAYVGCIVEDKPSKNAAESMLGVKVLLKDGKTVVQKLYPGGLADQAGISLGDQVLAVNGFEVNQDLDQWLTYFGDEAPIRLILMRQGQLKKIECQPQGEVYFRNYRVVRSTSSSDQAVKNYEKWTAQ